MSAAPNLVIFGLSNILSDLFDCALANGLRLGKIVRHLPHIDGERDISLEQRLQAVARIATPPSVIELDEFVPQANEVYMLGPTTPERAALAALLQQRFGLQFHTLVHPTAYVSPLASLGRGVFVGANSVIGPGAALADHVFINRGVTVGHDTKIASFSRLQPGCNVGGLSEIGYGVTVAIGATLLERLRIGDHAFIGAGAVATSDVEAQTLVVGIPAKFKKHLAPE